MFVRLSRNVILAAQSKTITVFYRRLRLLCDIVATHQDSHMLHYSFWQTRCTWNYLGHKPWHGIFSAGGGLHVIFALSRFSASVIKWSNQKLTAIFTTCSLCDSKTEITISNRPVSDKCVCRHCCVSTNYQLHTLLCSQRFHPHHLKGYTSRIKN